MTFIRPGLGRLLRRALLLKCPHCGGGGIFESFFKLKAHCPTCGLRLERGEGFAELHPRTNVLHREQHGLLATDRGHRGQHVHGLGQGGARDQVQAVQRDAWSLVWLHHRTVAQHVEEPDEGFRYAEVLTTIVAVVAQDHIAVAQDVRKKLKVILKHLILLNIELPF